MTAIIKFHFTGVVVRAALNNCGRWSSGGLKALGRALRKGTEGKQPIVNRHKFSMETLELLIRTGQFLEFKKKKQHKPPKQHSQSVEIPYSQVSLMCLLLLEM